MMLLLCSAFAGAWGTEDLLFNVEVNLCCRAVLGYLLAVQFHFQFRHRAHFRPRTVFAASATAFSAAFAKLSWEVPTTSITFCALYDLSLDFHCGLYR